jgi:hypothetical protein
MEYICYAGKTDSPWAAKQVFIHNILTSMNLLD